MSNISNFSVEEITNSTSVFESFDRIRFSIYIIFDVLSVVCSLFVLYYLLFDRTLRRALNNHVMIVLLIIGLINELISIPWILYQIQHNVPLIQTLIFSSFAFFFDYAIFTTQIILFAWATIERHILIFHDRWVSTRKKRIFVHYLPIIIILIYCLLYYSLITFWPFCENYFDVNIDRSLFTPCLFMKTFLGTWDLLAHQVVPTLIIVIFSIALIGCILRQKRRMNQLIRRRKCRKMTIQLLSISALYLVFNSPWTLLTFAVQYGLSEDNAEILTIYALFFRTFLVFLFPFVCCGSLPELRGKFELLFLCYRQQHKRVAPQVLMKTTFRLGGPTVGRNIVAH